MKVFLEFIQEEVKDPVLCSLLAYIFSNPLDETLYQKFMQLISKTDSQGLYSKLFIEALKRFKTIDHSTLTSPEERIIRFFNILPPLLLSPRFATSDIFFEASIEFRMDFSLILNALGDFFGRTNQFKKAKMIFSRALDIRRDLALEDPELRIMVVETLLNIGRLLEKEGEADNYREAGEAYYEAVTILRELREEDPETFSPRLTQILGHLAAIYEKLEHFEAAEKCLQYIISTQFDFIDSDIGIAKDVAEAFTKLGSLKERQKLWQDAETCYQQAVLIRRDMALEDNTYKPDLAEALYDLAVHFSRNGRLEAEEAFNEAARIYKQLGDEEQEKNTLKKLASFLHSIGKHKEAKKIQPEEPQVELKHAREDS
ncbi:MAG: tetratricopeptide repeat protein [Promethearchaeota archaeon]